MLPRVDYAVTSMFWPRVELPVWAAEALVAAVAAVVDAAAAVVAAVLVWLRAAICASITAI